jgi:hypothetical protein
MPTIYSLKVLMEGLIDYAGLFPPAELSMRDAVANYNRYVHGSDSWMLGRFVLPATRLAEFESILSEIVHEPPQRPWLLSVLIESASQSDKFTAALKAIADFNARQRARGPAWVLIDTLEGRASTPLEVREAVERVPQEFALFIELPLTPDLPALLDELQRVQATRRAMAKIRTGGISPNAIPSTDRVSAFIAGCAQRGLGFKATAGLHHAIRAEYRLTYCDPSPRAIMYGFLNVFIAACAALDNPDDFARIDLILMETDPQQFQFGDELIRWRDQRWSLAKIGAMRQIVPAFGSCSFDEPLDDLRSFRWLA